MKPQESTMVPLHYKNYEGDSHYNQTKEYWYGKILNIKNLVTYEARTYEKLREEFVIAVNDYEETLKEIGRE